MFDTFDLDRSNGCAFDRRKQCSAQGISHGRPEAPLKWLGREASVTLSQGFRVSRQTTRHLKSGPKIILIHNVPSESLRNKLRCPDAPNRCRALGRAQITCYKVLLSIAR